MEKKNIANFQNLRLQKFFTENDDLRGLPEELNASRPFESIDRGVGPAFDMSLEYQSRGVLEYHIIFGMRLVTLLRVIFSYYLTFQLEGCHGSGFEAYLTYP